MGNKFVFSNNVNTQLAGSFSSTATEFTLSSTLNVPASIPAGSYWVVSLNDAATGKNWEIIYVGAISGATCSNLLRAQEGTTALSWNTGDFAFNGPTSGQMANMVQGSYTDNFGATGYRISPDGFIEQWGIGGSNSSGIATVTFSIPFTTLVTFASASVLGSTHYNGDTAQIVGSPTTTGMTVGASNPVNGGGFVTFYWKAEGY